MKNVLLATTAVLLTAGFASAEVTLSGDGRMGIIHNGTDTLFTSRARVAFNLSGESDSGLSFGASFRADNAVGAAAGTAGTIYVKGAFGTLTFGDNDSAANQLVGNVDGVGLTGLGDTNELGYIGHTDTSVSYNHSVGAVAFAISTGQMAGTAALDTTVAGATVAGANADSISVAVKYSTDTMGIALGYEQADRDTNGVVAAGIASDDQLTLGLSGSFSGVNLKLVAADRKSWANTHVAVSAGYTTGATTVTAFYADHGASEAFGIGGSYDLGGGASFAGGIVDNGTDTVADMGLSFKF